MKIRSIQFHHCSRALLAAATISLAGFAAHSEAGPKLPAVTPHAPAAGAIVFQRGFVDEQSGFGGSLYVLNPATTADPFFFGGGNHPNYSLDGSQIVFIDADGDLSTTPADGYTSTHLVLAGGGSVLSGLKPKWSPDATLVAFETNAPNANKIVITSAACTTGNEHNANICNYTTLDQGSPAVSSDPAWFPTFESADTLRGGRLIFVSKANASATTGDIFATDLIIDANGVAHDNGTENLTNDPATYQAPSYSHDGTKIIYVQNGSLHLMSADGSNQRPIVSSANSGLLFGSDPAFSPDDSKIIYGDSFLYSADLVINANGSVSASNIQALTNSSSDRSPSWTGVGTEPAPPLHGGLSQTLFKVNGSSANHGALTGPVLSFSAQQSGRPAELAVSVQYSTTPEPNDFSNTSWTDLPTGTDGRMVYDPATKRFVLNTTGYPAQPGLYFRAVAEAQGYPTSISNYVGTFDGSEAGTHLPPLLMLMARNGTLADLSFTVGAKAAPATTDVHVQTSTTPTVERSWSNLDDGQTGRMHRSTNPNYPDVFLLQANKVPVGAGIYYRAIAKASGLLDSLSNIHGPFTVTSDTPPTVNISLTNSTSGSGTVSDPYVLPAGQIKFSITAAADPQRAGSQIVSLQPRIDGKTIQNFDHAPASVDFRYTQIGDHVLEAVAIDDLRAFGRAGTGAVYIRVIPEASTNLASLAQGANETITAAATSSGKSYTLVKNNAVWSDATAWTDLAGNHGVPGPNDSARIGSLTVGLQVGPNNDAIGTVNVVVGSIQLGSGGRFFGNTHATLNLKKTFTISGGELEDLDMTVEAGATCLFINEGDVTFGFSAVTNYGTWAIHGRGNIKGLADFRNHGTIDFQIPSTLSLNAAFDPTAGTHVLAANALLPLGGLITGPNPNALISQDGAGLINGLGSGLVGNAGGTLVGNAGGTLISQDGSGIVSHDGGGIVSHDGGGIVSHDGGGLIGNDGAGLVAAGAGNLVAAGAGNFVGGGHGRPARSSVSAEATPSGFIQEGGETDLSAATIAGPVTLNGGVLSGAGMIVGDLTNNGGYISPGHSAGALVVLGGFAQGANGTLIVENGGSAPGQYDQLISDSATLGGKLDVKLINGYTPDPADTFSPIGYQSVTGSFASVSANATVTTNDTGLLLTTNPALPSPASGRPRNIATRMRVETGDNVMIAGFIITGSASKQVLIRALGPQLTNNKVAGVLADPTLELHEPDGTVIANDNWKETQQSAIEETDLAPHYDLESAILVTLPPGAYTAIVRGKNGSTGVGLVEVYDRDAGSDSILGNLATRGLVQTDDNVLIGGIILGGDEPAQVLVRAIGPSLTARGVPGALADPELELHDANGGVISNGDWRETQEAEINAANLAPTDDREAAILVTLVPGNYTAIVRGKDGTTGVGLVEAFRVK